MLNLTGSTNGFGRSLFASVGDFLLPPICLGCAAAGSIWCYRCANQIAHSPFEVFAKDGLPIRSIAKYQGPTTRLVNAAKERASIDAVKIIATGLAEVVRTFASEGAGELGWGQAIGVCPIPASKLATKRRGFEPLRQIAVEVVARLGKAFTVCDQLANVRERVEQSGLSIAERAANAGGSFIWREPTVRARSADKSSKLSAVVIIDDVVTTGATLQAAAQALRDGGLHLLGCATFAATMRRALN